MTRPLMMGIALVVGLCWSDAGVHAQAQLNRQQQLPQDFGAVQPRLGGGAAGLQQGQAGRFGAQQNNQSGRQPGGLQPGNRNQQGFVGGDAQDAQAFFRNMGRRQQRRAMFDFALESLNEMRESRRRHEASRREPSPVRVQLRSTYLANALPASAAGVVLQERFTASLPSRLPSSPEVTLERRTATVRGVVASDYDRALAEKMLSLQPGVDRVNNRLTLEQPAEELPLKPAR